MNDVIERWREQVRQAATAGKALCLRGGGTKDFYGRVPVGDLLDTRDHAGVIAYEPTELVVTARGGTPLAELESLLAGEGQQLAFEPPHFGDGSTVGGCVAAGLSGPRRQGAGALRDFVLGVKILDGRGDVLNFGGQVMKNVAGYDVSRLIAGSLGTLGIILEVSLKVLPRPAHEATVRFAFDEAEAIDHLNRWGGQPLPVSASAWHEGVLMLRLSGAEQGVKSAVAKLGGEVVPPDEARVYWTGIREHTAAFFAAAVESGEEPNMPLWRVAVPTDAPGLALQGEQLLEWGGGLRWLRSATAMEHVRARAAELGGHATLFRGGDRMGEVFHPLPAPMMTIHSRLKRAFDPSGVFNPGRLYNGL
ncbi:MAG TPA: glycolate oxidase subunit GlcE [Rhodocyclaceae bacterium]|nr:glycolate oxidase subunit GlcE [Rhodocyclaceae bacterium]HRQ47242.1 glycolate oxidase subunit GlcE [Rhodocyclaceae bacterium]